MVPIIKVIQMYKYLYYFRYNCLYLNMFSFLLSVNNNLQSFNNLGQYKQLELKQENINSFRLLYNIFGGTIQQTILIFWSLNMQLILQNSKELKEVRQFIKGLSYVYDSIEQKEKQIYLYISETYIAIVNNFMKTDIHNYRVCFCKLKRNMYKLKNFNIGLDNQNENEQANGQNQGVIFYLDCELILKLLNTQVQSDIMQMILTFPQLTATGNKQYQMKMTYEADGQKGSFKLFTRLENSKWPFLEGQITSSLFTNSIMPTLLVFPPKFAKLIQYYKRFPQFWVCLNSNGITIKRTEGSYILSQQIIKKQQLGQYQFYTINQHLQQNTNLCLPSSTFFHHLQQSTRENRKTHCHLLMLPQIHEQSSSLMFRKLYMCLCTSTEKRQLHQLFQITARATMENGAIRQGPVQRLKLRMRDMKKEEEINNEQLNMLNYYGPDYEQTARMNVLIREGIMVNNNNNNREDNVGETENRGKQETITNPRKYKIQL